MALLRTSLSAKGLALSQNIMKTDQTLSEINDDTLSYDEQLYFFTVMGRPSATEPWGWQIDGHHLVINYFVLADQVVMTPVFMGGEPVVATTGKYAGNAVLQTEQDQGLAFMRALDAIATARRRPSGATSRPTTSRPRPISDNVVLDYRGRQARRRCRRRSRRGCWSWSASTSATCATSHAAVTHARGRGAPRRDVVRLGRRHQRRRGVLLPHPQPGDPDRVRPPAAGRCHQLFTTRPADARSTSTRWCARPTATTTARTCCASISPRTRTSPERAPMVTAMRPIYALTLLVPIALWLARIGVGPVPIFVTSCLAILPAGRPDGRGHRAPRPPRRTGRSAACSTRPSATPPS